MRNTNTDFDHENLTALQLDLQIEWSQKRFTILDIWFLKIRLQKSDGPLDEIILEPKSQKIIWAPTYKLTTAIVTDVNVQGQGKMSI
jgi:hypothetical protein